MPKVNLLLTFVAGCMAACGQKASDIVTITSTPPGATVQWNRQVIGVTPLRLKVGEYAFNSHKSSVFSKHLNQPVNLHVALAGYNPVDSTITGDPLTWTSADGRGHYTYYTISLQEFNFKLDKISVAAKAMVNADIIQLHAQGFGDELIIDKINATATAFTLELSDMVELRNAGISDVIIQAMMKKSTAP